MSMRPPYLAVAIAACLFASPVSAQVTRLEITSRELVADGRTFGAAGAYEPVPGTRHGGGGFQRTPPANDRCARQQNPNPMIDTQRALTAALIDWPSFYRVPRTARRNRAAPAKSCAGECAATYLARGLGPRPTT
jgi:hypothetical protein